MRQYVYKENEAPRVIYSRQLKEHLEAGWHDSPLPFLRFDTPEMKAVMDISNDTDVQVIGNAIRDVAEAANDLLNLNKYKKKKLLKVAERHGVEAAEFLSEKQLRAYLRETLANGDSTDCYH